MGKYLVRGWPDPREGQYRTPRTPYCMTQKECNNIIIYYYNYDSTKSGQREE